MKARLLAAALKEFASFGPAGARVERIADRAGCSVRMLYYYFGSKEELFAEVLTRKTHEHNNSVRTNPGVTRDRLIEIHEDFLSDPDYVRLEMWHALLADRDNLLIDQEVMGALYRSWVEWVQAEQSEGRIRTDLDPAQLVVTFLGITIVSAAFPQLVKLISGYEPTDPRYLTDRAKFLRTLDQCVTAPV